MSREVYVATVPYETKLKHDGATYSISIPKLRAPQCRSCGELEFGTDADDQIQDALRQEVGLLGREEIRANRGALGLTQEQLAEQLGVAAETISRWETGALMQSRAMDRLLRIFFAFPEVRTSLALRGERPGLGRVVVRRPAMDRSRRGGARA